MTEGLLELLLTRSAHLADVDTGSMPGSPERILVRSDLTGTMQLYENGPDGLVAMTALDDPVGSARYLGGTRRAVIEVDSGGNERYQLYVIDLEEAARSGPVGFDSLAAITSESGYGHHVAGVSRDARSVAYVSNKANGVDFDLWICDLENAEHRLVYAAGSWLMPGSGFSPDGRWVSVLRPGPYALDTDLELVEISTGAVTRILGHDGQSAEVGAPAWIDPTTFYVSSNVGRDVAAVVRFDLETGTGIEVPTGSGRGTNAGDQWDSLPITSADGSTVVVIENRNGSSAMTISATGDNSEPVVIPLPEPGVVMTHLIKIPQLSADGSTLYYTLSGPRLGGDVFAYDRDSGATRRLTRSPSEVGAERLVAASMAEVKSFDGESIRLFVYSSPDPDGGVDGGEPVVVFVHGGPESQSTIAFNPVLQMLAESGYVVVVPNVRGSTGYGKRFAALDDTTKRLDSVRDLRAIHEWLGSAGYDAGRAALWGGSYGGYMVLAGLAFQPDLWAAGVDIVGISDLVTFLENTSDYRRAHREREYGSLERDRAFLAEASPLRHADSITAPLFVIHGRNDPRVPLSEAEQLVANLESRGIPHELMVFDDEGHGLARLKNKLVAYPSAIEFLGRVLQAPG
jgi:acetyl esterase/lipase/Tol biopolymer transport system component